MFNGQKAYSRLKTLSAPAPALPAAGLLAGIIYSLSCELEENPRVYAMRERGPVWALFENSRFECESFFEEYGLAAASLSRELPVTVCGMTGSLEMGELTCRFAQGGNKLELIKENVSGKDFAFLKSLCVSFGAASDGMREGICELVSNIDYRRPFAVISRGVWERAGLPGLDEADPDAYFKYVALDGEAKDFISALDVGHIKTLWDVALKEGVSPAEFEYLLDAAREGENVNMFALELSLRLALDGAGYKISYDGGDFRVLNGEGKRLRLDYESGQAAEKLLLKLLFPVSPGPCRAVKKEGL